MHHGYRVHSFRNLCGLDHLLVCPSRAALGKRRSRARANELAGWCGKACELSCDSSNHQTRSLVRLDARNDLLGICHSFHCHDAGWDSAPVSSDLSDGEDLSRLFVCLGHGGRCFLRRVGDGSLAQTHSGIAWTAPTRTGNHRDVMGVDGAWRQRFSRGGRAHCPGFSAVRNLEHGRLFDGERNGHNRI